ncbi:putative COMM domain-containing protein 3 [Hypsibius exemplaris]|uniref:COMM domain-containing protein 3 n=1 Tax=Hypsibius exemplaris TaxID=2072580 RepID=A0A1W0WMW3_HYPEX|nr:putative COMM domain-containing protein 3 [Hypsibius exemplaris]
MDVLRISDDQHQWLRALSSETLFATEAAFQHFVEDVAESLVVPNHIFRILSEREAKEEENKLPIHQGVAALSSLFMEAAKRNSATDAVGLYLQAIDVADSRAKVITNIYTARRADLRKVLSTVGFGFPQITDVDWRLDWTIKSNELPRINEPVYRVKLETLATNGGLGSLAFSLSVEELQELVWSLKNAIKTVERHAQA